MTKLKLHSRIKIPVDFSGVGVVKPGDTFETDDERAAEFIQLEYAEALDSSASSGAKTEKKTTRKPTK